MIFRSHTVNGLFLAAILAGLPLCLCSQTLSPVTVQEDQRSFLLANGILAVRIQKASGDVLSIVYRGQELLAQKSSGGALGG